MTSAAPQEESTTPREGRLRTLRRRCLRVTPARVVLGLLILSCAISRFWGIDHDLPLSYYPDEVHFVKRSVGFGGGDLNPHWFHKPAFFMYILFFEYGLLFCWQYVSGAVRSVDDFALRFLMDPTPFFMIGRVTSALFGLGGVLLTYRVGRLAGGRWVGIGAAALLSATFAHNVSSMEVKADLPCTFFSLLSFFFLMRVVQTGRWKHIVLAGAAAGMGMATKYYTLYLLIPMGLAVLLNAVSGPVGQSTIATIKRAASRYAMFVVGTALFFLFFFLCSPYNYLDPLWYDMNLRPMIQHRFAMLGQAKVLVKMFHLLFGGEVTAGSVTVTAIVFGSGFVAFVAAVVGADKIRARGSGGRIWGYWVSAGFVALAALLAVVAPHFRQQFRDFFEGIVDPMSMGLPIGALGLAGLVFLVLRARATDLMILTAAFSFSVIASFYLHQSAEPRHLNPIYPFVAVAGAVLFGALVPRLVQRFVATEIAGPTEPRSSSLPPLAVSSVCVVLLGAIVASGVVRIDRWNRIQSRDDTRTLALKWSEENIPAGASVLVDKECVKLRPDEATIQRQIEDLDREIEASKARQGDAYEGGIEPFLVHKMRLNGWLKIVARELRARGRATYALRILDHPWWADREREDGKYLTDLDRDIGDPLAERTPKPLAEYRAEGVEYIITESGRYNQFLSEGWRDKWPSWVRFYEELAKLEVLHEIPADPGHRPGPTVRIYRLQ